VGLITLIGVYVLSGESSMLMFIVSELKGSVPLLSHLRVIASRDSGVAISMRLHKLQEIASPCSQ